MFSTPQYLIIGSDCWRQGIYRVNKFDRNKVFLEDAYRLPIDNDITHFTGRFHRFGNGEPVLVPFGRGDAQTNEGKDNQSPFILATFDGVHFTKIWEDLNIRAIPVQHFKIFHNNGKYYFTVINPVTGIYYVYEMELKYK